MNTDTTHFKKLLEAEYKQVEGELKTVGRPNPKNPAEWDAVSESHDEDGDAADENMLADSMDKYESNNAILQQLEIRLGEVKAALDRIKSGNYGVCEVCKKPIEKERLEANPAATTCMAHM